VAVGDTWTDYLTLQGFEQIKTTIVTTLDRVEVIDGTEVAVLERSLVVGLAEPMKLPPAKGANGIETTVSMNTLESRTDITLFISLESGHLLNGELKVSQTSGMDLDIKGMPNNQTMKTQMSQTVDGTGTMSFTYF
jgi:hypothetical protein